MMTPVAAKKIPAPPTVSGALNPVNPFCDTRHSDPTNKNGLSRFNLEGVQSFEEAQMASFNDRDGVKRSMRSASPLSPLQRAYLMGFRRARILARRDVKGFAYQFKAVNDEVHAERRAVRRELARLRGIDYAPDAERHDRLWLIASSTPLVSRLKGKIRTWRQRERERAELARMSEAELRDAGISSVYRMEEISKPFWRR